MVSNVVRKAKYIAKLKANGLYEIYKFKLTQQQRERRRMLSKHPKNVINKLLTSCRPNSPDRIDDGISQSQNGYRTSSALRKAAQKVKQALPTSLEKKIAVLAYILYSFDENIRLRILQQPVRRTSSNATTPDLVKEVKDFYERDDISRMSPDVKGCRKFLNEVTGQKEIKQIRHLMYRLSEVYALFIAEKCKFLTILEISWKIFV